MATVDQTGLVTAVGNGNAEIIATTAGVSGRAQVAVDQEIAALVFATQPTDAAAGATVAPAITVELRDAAGHRVADAALPVTLALAVNPGGATLAGTLGVTSSAGVATFDDVWLDKAANGYTLIAGSPDLGPDTSTAFAVHPASAEVAFLTQPGTAQGQVAFDPAVQVAAGQDRFGNPVAGAEVTLALGVSPTGDVLRGTTTVTAVSGVATFADINVALPGNGYVLEARSGSGTPARSDEFSVRLSFAEVSAGLSHTCGLTVAGFGYCWGENLDGRLGDGTRERRTTPTPVAGGLTFAHLGAGAGHTCGLTPGGKVFCWGQNYTSQLGDGTATDRDTPTAVAGARTFASLSVGFIHNCAVTVGSEVYCWGSNLFGALGDGTGELRPVPTRVASEVSFARVDVGGLHTCAVSTANDAYCWGANRSGELGDGTTDPRLTPTPVSGGSGFADVSANPGSDAEAYTCGVATAHVVHCWGANFYGELGDGTIAGHSTPAPVGGTASFSQVSAGRNHACGVTSDGALYCWGSNADGRLGDGTLDQRLTPAVVVGGLRFLQVSAGFVHTCGITTDNVAYCWGFDGNGQLGNGTSGDSPTPVRVVQ